MKIGVLALQGAFIEHINVMRQLGVGAAPIRMPGELKGLDGIIMPGGERTTIMNLLRSFDLAQPLREMAQGGFPIFGTCAGAILLANRQDGKKQNFLDSIDIDITRNAYGRQIDSRETDIDLVFSASMPFHAVFIRAPIITAVGSGVMELSSYNGNVILARQDNILVSTFHPELTDDARIHRYFLEMARKG